MEASSVTKLQRSIERVATFLATVGSIFGAVLLGIALGMSANTEHWR